MKTVAFVPIKLNNERLPGKNIKILGDGKPLLQFILSTLLQVEEISDVYVYCSTPEVKKYLLPGVKYLQRDPAYDTPSADINALFASFVAKVPSDAYVLAHATAPFMKGASISKGISAIQDGKYDSVVAVERLRRFLWDETKPLNYDMAKIPRTQDLTGYYLETTGFYIFTKDVMEKRHSRIGENPFLLEVSEVEALDVDTPLDFAIAQYVYSQMKTKT